MKGKMWHVIYEASRSAVVLEGEKSTLFSQSEAWHRVVDYHSLIKEVEQAELGVYTT